MPDAYRAIHRSREAAALDKIARQSIDRGDADTFIVTVPAIFSSTSAADTDVASQ